jgi:hypothetical protein
MSAAWGVSLAQRRNDAARETQALARENNGGVAIRHLVPLQQQGEGMEQLGALSVSRNVELDSLQRARHEDVECTLESRL